MKATIERKLTEGLSPIFLKVTNTSSHHESHADHHDESHFSVFVVSHAFEQKSPLERHRIVYKILKEELSSRLHALMIQARTPEEVSTSES